MRRRSWLKLGIAGAAVLAVGGGAMSVLDRGLAGGQLTEGGRTVFRNIARGALDGILPAPAPRQAQALDGLLDRIDALISALPALAQGELGQLLALLQTAPGRRLLAGLQPAWQQATVQDIQQALQSMRTSPSTLRQQAYHAMHDIVGAAYFSDRSTWPALGYPGPLEI